MNQDKREIRQSVLHTLSLFTQSEYELQSSQIASHLYKEPFWQEANCIALTISRFPEVDTLPIIREAWDQGKQVVLPRIKQQTKQMDFYHIRDFSQLEETVFGLKEPKPSETTIQSACTIDLMIVPGVAYTNEGYRIGFGGGYYDRYLPQFKGTTVSLLFQEQIVSHLPIEQHDQAISHLLYPGGVLR
ncbi:5-formyltetrahydrofolate cyclo-ligase [Alkalihalobacillus sp. NPDC078783]